MKIQHDGGPNLECRSAIRHSVRRLVVPGPQFRQPAGLKNREDENSDPLLLGFYDRGSWWQGETAGEYFISNSNPKSPQIRAHVTPREAVRRHVGCSDGSTFSTQ